MLLELNQSLTALVGHLLDIQPETRPARDSVAIPDFIRPPLQRALCEAVHASELVGQIAIGSATPGRPASVTSNRGERPGWSGSIGRAPKLPPCPTRSRLTAREREVLGLISSGSSNKEGAHRLQISVRTFEAHRAQIMRKLGARNAVDLVRMFLDGTC